MTSPEEDPNKAPFFQGVHQERTLSTSTGLPQDTQRGMRGKLVESILQLVVQAVTGLFLPGVGSAFAQLQAWANGIADAVTDVTDGIASIFSAFAGIDLSSPGAVVDSIQSIINAFLEAILAVIGDAIPLGIGTTIEQFGLAILHAINNSVDALQAAGVLGSQVGSLQNQVNTPTSISIPLSAHDGEASVVWENCDTDIVITPTQPRGAFIRPAVPNEKRTATIIAYKGAGCTGVYFDLVKLDPLTGGVTRIYQSGNEASNLSSGTTSADYTTLVHKTTVEDAVVVASGDNWGWEISTVGGNITLRGKTDANPALTTRPMRRGWKRTITSGARMPTSLSQSTMDAAYDAVTPYIEFDVDKADAVIPLMFFDDFERTGL